MRALGYIPFTIIMCIVLAIVIILNQLNTLLKLGIVDTDEAQANVFVVIYFLIAIATVMGLVLIKRQRKVRSDIKTREHLKG